MPMPWFRLYSELLSDRKLAYVASTCNVPKVTVIGFWTGLLCLANDSPERGKVLLAQGMPLDAKAIAENIGIDEATCTTLLDALLKVSMISKPNGYFVICKWDDRQFVSDDVAPRVRKSRAKKRSIETLPERYCNAPDQNRSEQIRSDQIRTEEESNAPGNISTDNPIVAMRAAQKVRRKLVDEWDTYLADVFVDYPSVLPQVKRFQLIGRENGTWIVKHDPLLMDFVHGRLPAMYDKMAEKCRFVA